MKVEWNLSKYDFVESKCERFKILFVKNGDGTHHNLIDRKSNEKYYCLKNQSAAKKFAQLIVDEELKKLKEIAEFCGTWDEDIQYVPDYLYDLNALHDAEQNLTPEHYPEYAKSIWREVDNGPIAYPNDLIVAMASAKQKSEAFLNTIRSL